MSDDDQGGEASDVIAALRAIVDEIDDELLEPHAERVTFTPETGIYEQATLTTPDGEVPAGEVYYWSTRSDGCHLVDIRQRNVPPGVDLAECSIEIRNDDGVPILAGDVVDEPPETIGEAYCLKVRPPGGGR